MQNRLAVIIHGPYAGNAYENIFKSILKDKKIIEKNFQEVEFVISTYIKDKNKTEAILDKYGHKLPIKIIYSKDLLNPGYFNLNRQVYSVKNAISSIDNNAFVVKLRNDQWIKWKKLIMILNEINFMHNSSKKFISTNCFTRKDRLYHPSDMFICGWKKDMEDYFSMPLMRDTHLNCQLKMLDELRNTSNEFYKFVISPESELFRHYLQLKNWDIKETFEDSYKALQEYIYLINTWDINIRWNKKRNADLPTGTIILPYRFELEPFSGAPKEKAVCYSKDEFLGKKTIRDILFLNYSKIVFDYKYKIKSKMKFKIKRLFGRIVYSKYISKSMRSALKRTYLGDKIKEFIFS